MKHISIIIPVSLMIFVLYIATTQIHQHIVREQYRREGRLCITNLDVTPAVVFSWNGMTSEAHKPRHYDYGQGLVGDWCPDEDYPPLPLGAIKGMLLP
jgi:hypothetical protein